MTVGQVEAREVAGHLAIALGLHANWCRANGLRVPAAVEQIAQAFTFAANGGQSRTDVEEFAELLDARSVTAPRVLTYEQTAASLNCSDRQIRRLVASGALPAVKIGGAVRVRTSDLDAYVESLPFSRNAGAA